MPTKLLVCALISFLICGPVVATCGGGGGGGVGGVAPPADLDAPRGIGSDDLDTYRVPWRILLPGDALPDGVLVLYWFPASAQEEHASELLASRQLTLAAARCVALVVVTSDNEALRAKYGVKPDAALAVLVDSSDGGELGRAGGKHGPLGRDEVETLVRRGIDRSADGIDRLLDGARVKAEHGDAEAAIAGYTRVWQARCLAPKPAKKAAKALKKLGHPVEDARLDLALPDERPATERAIAAALAEGLRAENALHIEAAHGAYLRAHRLDPADPVPLRFLGELDRHHIGDWVKARAEFAQILAQRSDPLSRAVALHGLGKMTIHDGDSAKGLALFEQSLAEYPLALTYRNLAVYWSSEGAAGKAYGYVQQAMALEPDDEYNQIFAATFLVELGRPAEAAAVAERHEAVLAASYNLAAIWAQLGKTDKALELLRRHFYTYERFAEVRRKEMHEARVDIVFASLKNDPRFVELTALDDHHGMR